MFLPNFLDIVTACYPIYHAVIYHNILLIGRNIKISHFKERLELELRSLAPENYIIRVYIPDNVLSYTWNGTQDMLDDPEYAKYFKMLKFGLPLESVKHALIRDG